MIYLSFLLFLFPDIASRTICQEHDGDDDPHDEHCKQVKPQGLDVPVANHFLTAIERCSA